MKTYLPYDDAEAQGLRDGTISLLVIPFTRQPPQDWSPVGCGLYHPAIEGADGETEPGPEIFGVYDEDWGLAAPYAPGDEIGMKEKWAPCSCGAHSNRCNGYTYPDQLGWNARTRGKVGSAKTMPMKAIRAVLLCQSVAGRQVQSISHKECLSILGCNPYGTYPTEFGYHERILREEWDRRHPDLLWAGNPWNWFVSVSLRGAR